MYCALFVVESYMDGWGTSILLENCSSLALVVFSDSHEPKITHSDLQHVNCNLLMETAAVWVVRTLKAYTCNLHLSGPMITHYNWMMLKGM